MSAEKVIVVDDEKSMREFLSIVLKKEGYEVEAFPTGEKALAHFKTNPAEVAIVDLKMPGIDGIALLRALKELNPQTVVMVITAYASVDSAVEAMKAGAYDYFIKPFNVDDIRLHIKRAFELKNLERENVLLKKDFTSRYGFNNLVGTSPKMMEVYELIKTIGRARTNILITGESGTGKELVARAIHIESDRSAKPFVAVNCGAIPSELLESELFGHTKGAFTGAVANKAGLVEMAAGSTLFLDEITELPSNLQVKFLRFIQDKIIRRVGSTADIAVDMRIIAATNKNIEEEVKSGRFREDLFYRLNVVRIDMPPLRERKDDIAKIAGFFLGKYNKEFKKNIEGISTEALDCLMGYDYPGNVRELENAIERAVALETKPRVSKDCLPLSITNYKVEPKEMMARAEGVDLEKTVSEFERNIIMDALKKAGGIKKRAAELLGISFRSMRYKLSKYGIGEE